MALEIACWAGRVHGDGTPTPPTKKDLRNSQKAGGSLEATPLGRASVGERGLQPCKHAGGHSQWGSGRAGTENSLPAYEPLMGSPSKEEPGCGA